MTGRAELAAPLDQAVRALEHARPAGNHGDNDGFLCGAHLAAVTPEGAVVKCGMLPDIVGGSAADGLRAAWRELPHFSTARLDEPCASCAVLAECRGGCRYRAGGLISIGPDPVQCHRYGVL
jgi:radical SAM protein with 4Fe4S-binding SPASM domain